MTTLRRESKLFRRIEDFHARIKTIPVYRRLYKTSYSNPNSGKFVEIGRNFSNSACSTFKVLDCLE